MSAAPLVLAIPSKGRLHDDAVAFLGRAGLEVRRGGGERTYRGALAGLHGIEVALLSASEIARELAAGNVHLGLTGLDLIHETVADAASREAAFHLVTPLGFGPADVVVAVPDVWIDVATMADLGDVSADFRSRHQRPLRVATKFHNLTRRHFAEHGVTDYRIVESLGATEGAPAAGSAELIVDITTTGATLAANSLRILDDGVILRSEAHLVAGLKADWPEAAIAAAVTVLDRVAAELRARAVREIRATMPAPVEVAQEAATRFGAVAPYGTDAAVLALHCPRAAAYDCAAWLKAEGAATVVIADVADVFEPDNRLATDLLAAIARRA